MSHATPTATIKKNASDHIAYRIRPGIGRRPSDARPTDTSAANSSIAQK